MIASTIRACFPAAAQVVADKADEINKLNVFPVPDGDTGTNMSLTLQTVVGEVEALPQDASVEDIAHAITHGSLMGARGNSGVITSQILRGIAEGLAMKIYRGDVPYKLKDKEVYLLDLTSLVAGTQLKYEPTTTQNVISQDITKSLGMTRAILRKITHNG